MDQWNDMQGDGLEGLEIEDILNTIDDILQAEGGGTVRNAPSVQLTEEGMKEAGFVESQIEEVMLGIRQQLNVNVYARDYYSWKQMREIRLGLLENLDTALYENPLYSAEQMREIRLGLIDHLDVSSYGKLIYTATDMASLRRNLLKNNYQTNPHGFGKEIVDEESGIFIRISDDCMEAYIKIPPQMRSYSAYELKRILMRHEVVHGIMMKQLEKAAAGQLTEKDGEILVARGKQAQKGKHGKYEYFFNLLLPESPKIFEDGTVDYTAVVIADKVKPGDPLAKYHPGSPGKAGETVTGILLEGEPGRELPPLTGQGFVRDIEKNIYTATMEGYVSLDEVQNILNVWNVFVVKGDVNRYNGNITYDGTIHVMGSVSEMAVITATGDIIVDGFVEAACIKAGGNVILKRGINGDRKGYIEAGGKVLGNFFEYATIKARGVIEGNYFLSCRARTDNSLTARGSKARIMGSDIKAGKSVECVFLDNYGAIKTVIEVGNLSWLYKKLDGCQKELYKVQDELRQLRAGRERLRDLLGDETLINNSLYRKTCLATQQIEGRQAVLEQEIHYFNGIRRAASKAYIKVSGRIQEGVTLIVNETYRKVTNTIKGNIFTRESIR